MKKITKWILTCSCMLLFTACSAKSEPWDKKETYQINDEVAITLKAVVQQTSIEPTNLNDEYQYWYTEEEGETLLDFQFYVENLSDEEIDLKDYFEAELKIKEQEQSKDLCTEIEDYTKIENETKLAAKDKTILHQIFYVKEKSISDDLQAEITLQDAHYTLSAKPYAAKVTELAKAETIELDEMSFEVLSASVGSVIPPLHPTDDSTYYIVEDETNAYAGIYLEITNTGKKDMELDQEICVSLDDEGTYIYAWYDILNADGTDFSEATQIPAGESRTVLFFGEVVKPTETKNYTVTITVEGKPYRYVFEHTVQ